MEKNYYIEKLRDVIFIILITLIALFFIKDILPIPSTTKMDLQNYIALAKTPELYLNKIIPAHHSSRILPSIVVWVMTKTTGISIETGFRIISFFAIYLFLILFYLFCRKNDVSGVISFTVILFILISSWPFLYNFSNIYQATDALTYLFTLLIIIFTLKSRVLVLLSLCLIGVFIRQNLFVLAVLSFIYLFFETGKKIIFICLVLVCLAFYANTCIFSAGGGGCMALPNIPQKVCFKITILTDC